MCSSMLLLLCVIFLQPAPIVCKIWSDMCSGGLVSWPEGFWPYHGTKYLALSPSSIWLAMWRTANSRGPSAGLCVVVCCSSGLTRHLGSYSVRLACILIRFFLLLRGCQCIGPRNYCTRRYWDWWRKSHSTRYTWKIWKFSPYDHRQFPTHKEEDYSMRYENS